MEQVLCCGAPADREHTFVLLDKHGRSRCGDARNVAGSVCRAHPPSRYVCSTMQPPC